MWFKSVITLWLALVFQLAQLLPGAAAIETCTTVASCCECCDPADSCPCAGNDETPQKHAPVSSESGNSLKTPVAKTSGTRVAVESLSCNPPSAIVAAASSTEQVSGFTGVRLSVAFCSFVI